VPSEEAPKGSGMKIAAIHQPQYFPYLGFFDKVARADVLVVMDTVQFQRRGVQHRNRIKTKDGWQWLTVPVLKPGERNEDGRSEQASSDVRIDWTDDWSSRHLRALRTNYARAPYLKTYEDHVAALLGAAGERLMELDMATTSWAMGELGIRTQVRYLSELELGGGGSELLIEACKAVGANTYLSGSGGRRYMDLSKFEQSGIEVVWQEFASPEYRQLFPEVGFVADLSILDVLLCCGPETRQLLGE
jgi:hypothetical protein